MDPNATLAELRVLSLCLADADAGDNEYHKATGRYIADDAARMAELFDALDTWMRRGGFMPLTWDKR